MLFFCKKIYKFYRAKKSISIGFNRVRAEEKIVRIRVSNPLKQLKRNIIRNKKEFSQYISRKNS